MLNSLPNRPRMLRVLTRTALAFLGAVLVWLLLVACFGVGWVGAALVGLAGILAFTAAIAPAVGCIVLSHARPAVLLLTPIAAFLGALGGVLGFHLVLQLLTSGVPWVLSLTALKAPPMIGVKAPLEVVFKWS